MWDSATSRLSGGPPAAAMLGARDDEVDDALAGGAIDLLSELNEAAHDGGVDRVHHEDRVRVGGELASLDRPLDEPRAVGAGVVAHLARSVDQSDEYAKISPDAGETPSQALSVQLTRTGALMGTPRFMAPEQYSGGKTDPRTDQFSFCVALYEALYGVPPFAGDSIATLGFNVVHGNVLSAPSEARVPTWMRQVLLRGLSVSPDDRYPSMDELLAALTEQGFAPRTDALEFG